MTSEFLLGMSWDELQIFDALDAEAEARNVHDLRDDPELNVLAQPIIERALARLASKRAPCRQAPVEVGFRTEREVVEHGLRAALYVGEKLARRFWPVLDDLDDEELGRLWTYIAAIIETDGLTALERSDADALARRVRLGVRAASWPLLAAIVDGNRVHENGGAAPDYETILGIASSTATNQKRDE